MKIAAIQDIKQHLSSYVDRATRGERIVITKHNRPVAMLTGIASPHLRIGLRIGKGRPKPMFKQATKGAYLATLTEDREER